MDPTVVVDGIDYAIHFQGFDAPLEVLAPSGARVCFPPWSYRQHLDALRECVLPGGGGLQLDSRAFARRVSHDAQIPETLQAELTPLALWWAAGGGKTQAAIAEGEWCVLDAVRVRLCPWSGGARFAALSQNLHQDGERTVLDLAAYLSVGVEPSTATAGAYNPVRAGEQYLQRQCHPDATTGGHRSGPGSAARRFG